ncbi:MAG: cell division protein FtsZ, partial [Rhodospirillaceae bacterium]|nr:cell division protein FtsZ [Rhodospirillaceae bacterium]
LIVIPNQNLFRIANEQTTFADAFNMADQVLYSGVRGVTDLMVMPGLINLDFADIRSVMTEMGKAMMGTGEADGERRALDAAEAAIANPLLDDTSMAGAKGVLINITGGQDMTLFETDEAANRIRSEVDDDAYIIFGSTFDDSLEGRIRVSIVATGMDRAAMSAPKTTLLSIDTPARASATVAPADEEIASEAPTIVEAAGLATAGQDEGEEDFLSIPSPEAEPEPEIAAEAETEIETEEIAAEMPEPEAEEIAAPSTDIDPGEAVPASPGTNATDSFIPPAPAEAKADEESAAVDPYAAAAMVNGSSTDSGTASAETASEPKAKSTDRKLSLFERVTGIGNVSSEQPEQIEPVAETPEPSLKLAASTPDPMPEPVEETAEVEELGGLDESDRVVPAQPEEDLLDIPAFLRRQAN